jgi:hypothetical protein
VTVLRCREGEQSEEVAKLNTGKDAGYRLLMHPSGRALVCGMSIGGLQRVDLQPPVDAAALPKLSLSQGEASRRRLQPRRTPVSASAAVPGAVCFVAASQ